MKYILIISVVLMSIISTKAIAQNYDTSLGLRAGFSQGFTIKSFISDKAALEGIFSSRWRGFTVVGLYEIHNQAFDEPGLTWYYGAGAHLSTWNGRNVSWVNDNDSYLAIGLDGIIGLEYTLADYPFNISLDWKPAFNLIGYSSFVGDAGALSIRYIID
jgi:hypothetical protein